MSVCKLDHIKGKTRDFTLKERAINHIILRSNLCQSPGLLNGKRVS